MKRLIDRDETNDATLAKATALLRSIDPITTAGPVETRIRARLNETPTRPTWVRSPAIAAVLLLATAVGAAVVVPRLDVWTSAPAASTKGTAPDKTKAARLTRGATRSVIESPRSTIAEAPAPAPSLAAVTATPAARTVRHRAAHKDATPAPPPTTATPTPAAPVPALEGDLPQEVLRELPGAELLISAIRALRHAHDATTATRLVDEYLQLHPHGVLVEEALALGVDAAARIDDPRGVTWAGQYLTRFPSGRHLKNVRRGLVALTATKVNDPTRTE